MRRESEIRRIMGREGEFWMSYFTNHGVLLQENLHDSI